MTETTALILSAFTHFLHIGLVSRSVNRTPEGRAWNASPRDTPRPPVGPMAGRAERALDNHLTALVLFAAAVAAVMLRGESSWVTAVFAWVFVLARLLYIPAYLQGWTPWRSAIWGVGALSTAILLLAALF